MSLFDNLQLLPEDPVMGIPVAFAKDPRPRKVNLGIGVYRDGEGNPLILNAVRSAEKAINEASLNKEYLPIEGSAEFRKSVLGLLFRPDSPAITSDEVFCAQTVGGTSALRVGGEFLNNNISHQIFISDVSWPNHKLIFTRAGMEVGEYPYYDSAGHSLNFEGMCQTIAAMPPHSSIVLQASCHNPTGLSPSSAQWEELSHLIKKKQVIPFFDIAYQGFGHSLQDDIQPVFRFLNDHHEMLIAYSFSKNFGLYGERCGFLCAVTHSKETSNKIGSHFKQIIRAEYSNPPLHPARIVTKILQTETLKQEWIADLDNMRHRIAEMRKTFIANLQSKTSHLDFSYMQQQEGLFSFCGLGPDDVHRLRQEHGIYLLTNGRINIASLNWQNMNVVVDAITSVLNK